MSDFNIDGLKRLVKALKSNGVVKVGILSTADRAGKVSANNASIGAVHEFGSANGIPRRSFLRMPIQTKLPKALKASGMFDDEAVMKMIVEERTIEPLLKEVGIIAERVVLEAFETGGFGKWPPWKSPGYSNNANMLLVDTQQLRNSITSEVEMET